LKNVSSRLISAGVFSTSAADYSGLLSQFPTLQENFKKSVVHPNLRNSFFLS